MYVPSSLLLNTKYMHNLNEVGFLLALTVITQAQTKNAISPIIIKAKTILSIIVLMKRHN